MPTSPSRKPITHYDPTQRTFCAKHREGDFYAGKRGRIVGQALLVVDCPHCMKKVSYKKLQAAYEVVERAGFRCVRLKRIS